MHTKIAIAASLGIGELMVDMLSNGITTMHGISTGHLNATTQAWNIPTAVADKGDLGQGIACAILIALAAFYCLGVIGPKASEEHIDGCPVDASLHESIFGTQYRD